MFANPSPGAMKSKKVSKFGAGKHQRKEMRRNIHGKKRKNSRSRSIGLKPKKKERSMESVLSSLRSKLNVEEAKNVLEGSIKKEKIFENLTSGNWKNRVESFKTLSSECDTLIKNEKIAESVLVYLKTKSKNFKESNLHIVRGLLELSQTLVKKYPTGPVFHTCSSLLTEMLSSGKHDTKIQEIIDTASDGLDLNEVTICMLDSFRTKF